MTNTNHVDRMRSEYMEIIKIILDKFTPPRHVPAHVPTRPYIPALEAQGGGDHYRHRPRHRRSHRHRRSQSARYNSRGLRKCAVKCPLNMPRKLKKVRTKIRQKISGSGRSLL